MSTKTESLRMRHRRIRKKVSGTAQRPRLAVHFSERHIQAQVIDDSTGRTLASAHTTEPELQTSAPTHANVATAIAVGRAVAERSLKASISKVVFDRGGFKYHGKVKALADAARQAGLEF